jgi:hypothetical protein
MHGNKGHVELENGKPLSLSQLGKTSKHHPHDEDVLYIGEDAWQRGSFRARTTHTHTPTEKTCLPATGRRFVGQFSPMPTRRGMFLLAIVGSEIQAWLLRLPVSFQESACLDFGSIYRMDISLLSRRKFDLDYYCKIFTRQQQ